MAERLAAARPDALIVVAAEHFANFFMNNMPSFAVGMADRYEGPIEDPAMAGHRAHHDSRQRGALQAAHSRDDADRRSRVRRRMEIRSRHHGAAAFPDAALRSAHRSDEHQLPGTAAGAAAPRLGVRRGAAPRRGLGAAERIALVGTGGISHWPATPDSGKINEAWDREFLGALAGQRQGRRCFRTPTRRRIATPGRADSRFAPSSRLRPPPRGAARSQHYRAIPMFAVGCTIADMSIGA